MVIFLIGILGGIALSLFFSFGPAFFSQMRASIHYGFRNAVPFAFGVSSSDVIIVAGLLIVSHTISMDNMMVILNNRWVLYVGATVVAGFGLYTIFLKTRHAVESTESDRVSLQNVQTPSRLGVYMRGLTLNFFNPLVWLYWATMVTIVIYGDEDISLGERYLFFGGVLTATLCMDVLKCKLASLLQRIITYKFLTVFNKCVGCVLIVFSIVMVLSTTPKFERDNSNQKSIEMMQELIHNR